MGARQATPITGAQYSRSDAVKRRKPKSKDGGLRRRVYRRSAGSTCGRFSDDTCPRRRVGRPIHIVIRTIERRHYRGLDGLTVPGMINGLARRRSRARVRFAASTPGGTANSSPPMRATTSPSRTFSAESEPWQDASPAMAVGVIDGRSRRGDNDQCAAALPFGARDLAQSEMQTVHVQRPVAISVVESLRELPVGAVAHRRGAGDLQGIHGLRKNNCSMGADKVSRSSCGELLRVPRPSQRMFLGLVVVALMPASSFPPLSQGKEARIMPGKPIEIVEIREIQDEAGKNCLYGSKCRSGSLGNVRFIPGENRV